MKINIFSGTVYVKIYKNKFTVRHIESNTEVTRSAIEPFTTKRLLVGEFISAANLLGEIIKDLYTKNWFSPSPIIIMHPMTMIEGGLSDIEERILRELATDVGARKVIIWTGHELTNEEVTDKSYN